MRQNDLFERDLKNVLDVLEKLCRNKADHIDYVTAYKMMRERDEDEE
jgi:hypothetical protein